MVFGICFFTKAAYVSLPIWARCGLSDDNEVGACDLDQANILVFSVALVSSCRNPKSGLEFACDPDGPNTCISGYICVKVEPGHSYEGVCRPAQDADISRDSGPEDAYLLVPAGYVLMRPGPFMMGSPDSEPGRDSDECLVHEVTIRPAFFLKATEVTQDEWKAVMGNNPSYFQSCGDSYAVGGSRGGTRLHTAILYLGRKGLRNATP